MACLPQALPLPGQLCGWRGTREAERAAGLAWGVWVEDQPSPAPGSGVGGPAGAVGCRAPSSLPPSRVVMETLGQPRLHPLLLLQALERKQQPEPFCPRGSARNPIPAAAASRPPASHKQEVSGQVSTSHPGSPPHPHPHPRPRLGLLGFPPRFLRLCAPVSPITAEDGSVAPSHGVCQSLLLAGSSPAPRTLA